MYIRAVFDAVHNEMRRTISMRCRCFRCRHEKDVHFGSFLCQIAGQHTSGDSILWGMRVSYHECLGVGVIHGFGDAHIAQLGHHASAIQQHVLGLAVKPDDLRRKGRPSLRL